MRKYTTFAEMEKLLLTAANLPGSNIKSIAAATGIQANTLYKWKTTSQPSLAGEGRQAASLLYGE